MPQVKISEQAQEDLGRFADFLVQAGVPEKAEKVALLILESFEILQNNPLIGRVYQLAGYENFRELVIKYGKSGYTALYHVDLNTDIVTIHTIKHQKEFGYMMDTSDSQRE